MNNANGSKGDESSPDGKDKKAINFNTSNLSNYTQVDDGRTILGPLCDDGAPYSGIGQEEFLELQHEIHPEWNGQFEEIPDHEILCSYYTEQKITRVSARK